MRKFIIAVAVLAIALAFVPASAAPLPEDALPNSCLIAGVVQAGDDSGREHCEFEVSADIPVHGYLGVIPNDFIIWDDANNDNNVNAGEAVYEEVSPTAPPAMMANALSLTAGDTVDVAVSHGCAEVACGWVGLLLVG